MKKRNVSKQLGLKPMSGKATVKDYQERIKTLQRKIGSGNLRGILLQRAHEYIRSAQFRIRKMQGIQARSMDRTPAAQQLSLPGMLSQLSIVRIEELIAEKLAHQVRLAQWKSKGGTFPRRKTSKVG